MFYPVDTTQPQPQADDVRMLAVFNPAQSRRLVAKAAAACPVVRAALESGTIIIGRGITAAYVTEEILGTKVEPKADQTVGFVGAGALNVNTCPPPSPDHVIRQGQVVHGADSTQEIKSFGPGDVFIKGANAIDPQGVPGVWVAHPLGGTVGMSWPIVTTRAATYLVAVSLEKLVPDVMAAAAPTGIKSFKYAMGMPCKLIPLTEALVITEIEALAILCGVRAVHAGSGGVAGSEGSVHLVLDGPEEAMQRVLELVKELKRERPVGMPSQPVFHDAAEYEYDAARLQALMNR